ncbi:MAG: hypothetical protein Ct9H90mP9_0800 [Pseudomonadota bacterium]|nr:MAG: hypothetical protein Ct9H90mP9_0800 [Pseudomonadota bacterium]
MGKKFSGSQSSGLFDQSTLGKIGVGGEKIANLSFNVSAPNPHEPFSGSVIYTPVLTKQEPSKPFWVCSPG